MVSVVITLFIISTWWNEQQLYVPCMMMTITKFKKHVSLFPKIAPQNCPPLHRNSFLLLWQDNKLIIGTSSARKGGTGNSKRNIIVHLYHISSFYDLLLTFYRFITVPAVVCFGKGNTVPTARRLNGRRMQRATEETYGNLAQSWGWLIAKRFFGSVPSRWAKGSQ